MAILKFMPLVPLVSAYKFTEFAEWRGYTKKQLSVRE